MEYFTFEADRKDIRRFGAIFASKKVIVLGIVVLFLLVRAAGMVWVEFNWLYAEGDHQSKSTIEKRWYEDDDRLMGSTGTFDDNLHQSHKDNYRAWGIDLTSEPASKSDCHTEEECLEKAVKRELRKNGELAKFSDEAFIKIESLETSGAYWMPLIKNGKTSYHISVENKSESKTYAGSFSGTINFNVYGVCSVGALKKTLFEKIAQSISGRITSDYKK